MRPVLIFAFSDLQADIAAALVRRGHPVFTFNQRSVDEILQRILVVGGIVGCAGRARTLVDDMRAGLDAVAATAARPPRRPRVFFEEWDDPLISGIQWVEELVEIAGGTPIFPELRDAGLAKDRIVDPAEVVRRDPEVIVGSWCGKAVRPATITGRPGWDAIAAVRQEHVYEIKSAYILHPGPAALTEGLRQLHACLGRQAGV